MAVLAACGSDDTPERMVDAPAGAPVPFVQLAEGVIKGVWIDGGLRAFLGVPYAQPPVGALRWQPPKPVEKWEGGLNANKFGARCPQAPSSDPLNVAKEDCLHLNVWAPANAKNLPVMVWIHGGGNISGSNTELPYDGQYFARRGVVFVSINYRLGVFGFFAAKELADEKVTVGNQGLWDQQLALTWVKKNIEKFGGDPANVTLFGGSSGSVDVCMHVASPRSRGLFHRAISQSGGCTTRALDAEFGERVAAVLAMQLDCKEDVLACLRDKSITELVDAGGAFGPIVDGEFLPKQPRELFDSGDIAKVPYLLGSNTDEGSFGALDVMGVTNDEQYLAALGKKFVPPVEPIAMLYPSSRFSDAKDPYQAAVSRAMGDEGLVCTTHDVAMRAAKAGLNVHMYNFDVSVDPLLGAAHTAEVLYVFGSAFVTSKTREVSDRMQKYWVNFAKTGDPNGGDLLDWPAFTTTADKRINFGETESTILSEFRAADCRFWRERFDGAFAEKK